MESLFKYVAPPSQCGYLPDEQWTLEYEVVGRLGTTEYMNRLRSGWRRFGTMLFRPVCATCRQCKSLRVIVDRFRPNRSQRRVDKQNVGQVELRIGKPSVTRQKLELYDRYHAFQSANKGWPEHPLKDGSSYAHSFVENPFSTEEWCFYLKDRLVGVGYVDDLPAGLSAIYFIYEPSLRRLSLGTWNVLSLIRECTRRHLPHVYLGYFVADCSSLEYKSHFVPNEILGPDGSWVEFRGE